MIAHARRNFALYLLAYCILFASKTVNNYGFTLSLKTPPTSCGRVSSCSSSTSFSKTQSISRLAMSSIYVHIDPTTNPLDYSQSLPVSNIGPHIKIKGKTVSAWGMMYAITTFATALVVLPFMFVLSFVSDNVLNNKKRRKAVDWTVHLWAKVAMKACFTSPKVYGLENLPKHGETVMYVPNHTSFMDILMLSGFVPRPFKYLSKEEIRNIPVIGTAMNLAMHVFLKRDDLKSTLEVTDTTVQRLKDGNSMVLFAEGTRSPDGQIKTFKKGAFQMAKAAGVKIVPVSIGNMHRWMPKDALLPLAPIRHTYIRIHPAIETEGKPVSKIRSECFEAVNSGLPLYQQSTDKKVTE